MKPSSKLHKQTKKGKMSWLKEIIRYLLLVQVYKSRIFQLVIGCSDLVRILCPLIYTSNILHVHHISSLFFCLCSLHPIENVLKRNSYLNNVTLFQINQLNNNIKNPEQLRWSQLQTITYRQIMLQHWFLYDHQN